MSTQSTPRPTTAADLPPSPPPRKRGMGTVRSMIISMGVLTAMLLAFYAIVARPDRAERLPVDAVVAVKNAREVGKAPFAALEPTPSGWMANNALYSPAADGTPTWSVGYLHDDAYYGVRQTVKATNGWYSAQLADFRREGSQQVDGVEWEQWFNPTTEERRLVKRGPSGPATVVVTSRSYADAATFLRRLTPRP